MRWTLSLFCFVLQVYMGLGFTMKDLQDHFGGPAFLAWWEFYCLHTDSCHLLAYICIFFLPWFRYKSQIWWTFPLKENSNWKMNISIKIYIRTCILIKFYHIIPYHYTLVIQLAYFYVSSGQEWGTCMDGAGPSPRTG